MLNNLQLYNTLLHVINKSNLIFSLPTIVYNFTEGYGTLPPLHAI